MLFQLYTYGAQTLQNIFSCIQFFHKCLFSDVCILWHSTGLWCSGITTVTICIHALIAAMRDACDCLPSAVLAFLIAPVVVGGALPTSFKVIT